VLTSHDLLYTGRAELGSAPNDQQHERRTNRAEDVFGDLVAAGEHHHTLYVREGISSRLF
jgi:hypothetical protein